MTAGAKRNPQGSCGLSFTVPGDDDNQSPLLLWSQPCYIHANPSSDLRIAQFYDLFTSLYAITGITISKKDF